MDREILILIWALILMVITVIIFKKAQDINNKEKYWMNVMNSAWKVLNEQRKEELKELLKAKYEKEILSEVMKNEKDNQAEHIHEGYKR